MKMKINTDSKAILQLNQEIHSEDYQTCKMELSLGNSSAKNSLSDA